MRRIRRITTELAPEVEKPSSAARLSKISHDMEESSPNHNLIDSGACVRQSC
jgi:hypothetical protein